jgi:hypothetical protein
VFGGLGFVGGGGGGVWVWGGGGAFGEVAVSASVTDKI